MAAITLLGFGINPFNISSAKLWVYTIGYTSYEVGGKSIEVPAVFT